MLAKFAQLPRLLFVCVDPELGPSRIVGDLNFIGESTMNCKYLTALPVFNEVDTAGSVLDEVGQYCDQILVVDDGSSDGTSELLAKRDDIILVSHPFNTGYGSALISAFEYAMANEYDVLVTIDCDGQHEPQRIKQFVTASQHTGADIVSGSRYLKSFDADSPPPAQRRRINHQVTKTLNERLGFGLTDAFCGFKAYRVPFTSSPPFAGNRLRNAAGIVGAGRL